MGKETPSPESGPQGEKTEVIPAEIGMGTKNCIVVKEGEIPTLIDIVRAAVKNEAHIDNSDDEAGDDEYVVQFPGGEQERLMQDGISGRLRELSGEGGE